MIKWNLLAFVSLFLITPSLMAQDASQNPLLANDWVFRIGGQESDANVEFGLANPMLGEIPIIDLNKGDGNTTLTSLFGNVLWQAPDRWMVGFSYFAAEVESERLSDRDIEFGDITIPENSGFRGDFTTDFYVLNAYYDLFNRDNQSAGIGMGLYALDLGASVELVNAGQTGAQRASTDVLAPLPTLSAYYRYAFSDKWAFMADIGWLSANIDKYDGEVLATRISVDYWINDNWGLGAGFTYVDLDLEIDNDVFDEIYKVEYDSLFIYGTFSF